MQGVLNVIIAVGPDDGTKKRWELWHPKSMKKWVIWASVGQVLWLPPGWHHQVTTFNGNVHLVRV